MEGLVKALQEEVRALRKQTTILKDIEEIKKVQRAYGHYLENWMTDEVVDLSTCSQVRSKYREGGAKAGFSLSHNRVL